MKTIPHILILVIGLCSIHAAGYAAKPKTLKVDVTIQRTSEAPISKYIFGSFIEAGFGRQSRWNVVGDDL